MISLLLALILPAHALNPSRVYKQRPEKYLMTYEATKTRTADGASLAVWVIEADVKTNRLVLIAHDGEGNMGDHLELADQLNDDATVVIFDWRGFGESSEFDIDSNMYIYAHFQDDIKAMIDFCRQQHQSITIVGQGMGAGLALGIGWHDEDVSQIIADTPFLSMEDLETRFAEAGVKTTVPSKGYESDYEPIYALAEEPVGDKAVLLLVENDDPYFEVRDLQTLVKLAPDYVEKSVYVEQSTGATREERIADYLSE